MYLEGRAAEASIVARVAINSKFNCASSSPGVRNALQAPAREPIFQTCTYTPLQILALCTAVRLWPSKFTGVLISRWQEDAQHGRIGFWRDDGGGEESGMLVALVSGAQPGLGALIVHNAFCVVL